MIFHAGGIFRRCSKPLEEMVKPNIAMAEALEFPLSHGGSLVVTARNELCVFFGLQQINRKSRARQLMEHRCEHAHLEMFVRCQCFVIRNHQTCIGGA